MQNTLLSVFSFKPKLKAKAEVFGDYVFPGSGLLLPSGEGVSNVLSSDSIKSWQCHVALMVPGGINPCSSLALGIAGDLGVSWFLPTSNLSPPLLTCGFLLLVCVCLILFL